MHRVRVIIHARTHGASAELLANGNLSFQDQVLVMPSVYPVYLPRDAL